jgi:hypothetical protein
LLGSGDGTTWDTLDQFAFSLTTAPTNNVVLPLNINSNTSSYLYYRLVCTSTFGSDYVSVSEFALFDGGSNTINRYIRPIVLKDCVLHPIRVFSTKNIYRITDLSGNWKKDGVHNGYYTNIIMTGGESTATTFNGEYHIICSKTGEAVHLSNMASLTNMILDTSLNGIAVSSGLTDIRTACYNRRFILLAGAGGASYGILNSNSPPTFYASSLTSLMTTIYGLSSNSGYGFVVCNNTICLKESERLSITTPKYYSGIQPSDISIGCNVYKL